MALLFPFPLPVRAGTGVSTVPSVSPSKLKENQGGKGDLVWIGCTVGKVPITYECVIFTDMVVNAI